MGAKESRMKIDPICQKQVEEETAFTAEALAGRQYLFNLRQTVCL